MKIARVPVSEQTHEILKQAIITGMLAPGERLYEEKLTEKLEVSRTPLREAISKLELEGLVYKFPTGGTFVTKLSIEQVKQIYSVRSVLEGLAVREAVEKITQTEISRFREISNKIAHYTERGENEEVASLGSQFHDLIHKISGNQVCMDMMKNLSNHIERYRRIAIAVPGRKIDAYKEHLVLIELLSNRQAVEAEQSMREHVLKASITLINKLNKIFGLGGA